MKALDLSKEYFHGIVFPELQNQFPELSLRMAAGLVGNGSECFGYDDEISRDHDWGVDFFIWLPDNDRSRLGEIAAFKEDVFQRQPPDYKRDRSEFGADVNVGTVEDFYKQLIGFPQGPDTIGQWRLIPEENLAMAVNGQVFYDGYGRFTETRKKVLQHYPEDLRKKKMAARCMAIAQTGQYNFPRMSQRRDWVAVQTVLCRFCENATGLVFLLNRTFRPFYKWAHRRMKELKILGDDVGRLIFKLALVEGFSAAAIDKRRELISRTCSLLAAELRRQALTSTNDWFFTTHAQELQQSIKDEFLSSLPPQYE